ncbi:MAG: SulP family inorganic anion transporter [Methylococcales bacterium]|nr:SulP family inorganic anion transporter [Methylococcales bacterium]
MPENQNTLRGLSRLPILQGVLPIDNSRLAAEIVAGLTLAALAIPEVMGYTKISGTPVVTGLYTILIPMLLFSLFGSSRHLVVGADSATAAILAAGLTGLAATGSEQYLALAGVLALMAAGFLLIARFIGLGFMADFLSRTVLIGFLTGVGVQVAFGQIAGMLGLKGGGHGTLLAIGSDLRQLEQINPYALGIAVCVLLIITGARRLSDRIPGALLAVAAAIFASWLLDLKHYLPVLGAIPEGLPHLGLPAVSWDLDMIETLVPVAFAMFVVILAQSAATSRAYAARYGEDFSENTDLVGLGLANIGAGLSGAFVVNGSPTKTQMVDSAGGRSQLALIVTTLVVLLVLVFLTGPLAYMPDAVLSAVVFLIGLDLMDIKGMRSIYLQRRAEFWVALATAMMVVLIGVEQGILLAIVLSLIVHTRRGYRPRNAVLVPGSEPGVWYPRPVESRAQAVEGLMLYRFTHSMYYANAELLSAEVNYLCTDAQPPLRWFCLDVSAIDDIDYTAAETLRAVYETLKARHIRMVFAHVLDNINQENYREFRRLLGDQGCFGSLHHVIAAYRLQTGLAADGEDAA